MNWDEGYWLWYILEIVMEEDGKLFFLNQCKVNVYFVYFVQKIFKILWFCFNCILEGDYKFGDE